jgi:hypothetical protein
MLILLLSEGRAGEYSEPPNKAKVFLMLEEEWIEEVPAGFWQHLLYASKHAIDLVTWHAGL